jgi:hypothetical protein
MGTHFGEINFLFCNSFVTASGAVPVWLILRNCSAVSSTGFSTYSSAPPSLPPDNDEVDSDLQP